MRIYTVFVRACTVYYVTDDEIKTKYDNMVFRLFKQTVQRDFQPPVFHNSSLPGPLTNGFKYFKFWFSLLYSNFSESPRSIILRRVSLPTV